MKILIFLLGILAARGQDVRAPFLSDTQLLTQQGSLVKVAISRGEPIRLYVFGREEVQLDLTTSDWNVELDPDDFAILVKRVGPGFSKILKVSRENRHFVIPVSDDTAPYTLEITTGVGDKKETFRFRIDNRPK